LGRVLKSPGDVAALLGEQRYVADPELAITVHLARAMRRPILLEGEPGVGKTELAKAWAAATGAELIRLQCHEGIEAAQVLYDWDHRRQLLAAGAATGGSAGLGSLYGEDFLVERPLLAALRREGPVVLLVDEVDRADEAFEALLLEVLDEHQITVPELGTVKARRPPFVVLTSNRTRELSDALKRRCLFHWIGYPSREVELEVLRLRTPEAAEELRARVVDAVAALRRQGLYKPPGVGEAITWVEALTLLGDGVALDAALGVVVKGREDLDVVRAAGVLDGA